MKETSGSRTICTKLEQIAKQAKDAPEMEFTTLAHHIDIDWLREAYRRTRKNGATGVDGETGKAYGTNLEANLGALLERAKSGTYRAPPVRRVHIPKGDGSQTRPIGIPTFEDKVLQRAVAMILEAIYEQDFVDASYGFRPGKSAHDALEFLGVGLVRMSGGWVLEIDVKKYFDTIDHGHLRQILRKRVRDGVLLRLIDKWLNAGVMEDGHVAYPESGSPQGGVISPILANIFLHEILDRWFEKDVQPRMRGRSFLIRYADDAVLVFARESDARRVLTVLPKRFGRYALTLHPEKTRLIEFVRPDWRSSAMRAISARPGSFDLLGFTHFWSKSRRGNWIVQRKTAQDRFSRALKRVTEWCRINRHQPVPEQWHMLVLKLKGHFGYYGITGNYAALRRFQYEVVQVWRKWLGRRSQRATMTVERTRQMLKRFPLPSARITRKFSWS